MCVSNAKHVCLSTLPSDFRLCVLCCGRISFTLCPTRRQKTAGFPHAYALRYWGVLRVSSPHTGFLFVSIISLEMSQGTEAHVIRGRETGRQENIRVPEPSLAQPRVV